MKTARVITSFTEGIFTLNASGKRYVCEEDTILNGLTVINTWIQVPMNLGESSLSIKLKAPPACLEIRDELEDIYYHPLYPTWVKRNQISGATGTNDYNLAKVSFENWLKLPT